MQIFHLNVKGGLNRMPHISSSENHTSCMRCKTLLINSFTWLARNADRGKIIELCSLSLQIFYYKTVSGVGLFGVCSHMHG